MFPEQCFGEKGMEDPLFPDWLAPVIKELELVAPYAEQFYVAANALQEQSAREGEAVPQSFYGILIREG